MTEQEAAVALTAFVEEKIPALAATYPYNTLEKGELPDAMVEVLNKRITRDDPAFPYAQLQQVYLKVFQCGVSFLVDADSGTDAQQTELLRGFGATLEDEATGDATLGGRVQFCSPLMTFDYDTPFIQYQDGTRGRQMVWSVALGEVISGVEAP